VLITLVTPLHRPSSANIAASVCSIGNKKEHCRHRPAASDGGPGSPIPSVWGLVGDHVPLRIARLRFDRCTTAPETWLLPAVLHAHPLVSSTDCPSASNGGGRRFPSPPSRGPSAIALPRSRSLCSLLPRPFCDVSGAPHPLCRSIDRVPTSARNSVADRPVIAPPSRLCRRSNSDHTGKRYVLGRNRVSIETRELRLSTQECDFPGTYELSKLRGTS